MNQSAASSQQSAVRDLTTTQYLAALHRNGFQLVKGMFAGYVTHPDAPGVHFGPIVDRRSFRIMRRASVVHFISALKRHRQRRAA